MSRRKKATTVYLWPDQPAAITDMAERDLCSEAEVIRDALDAYLYQDGPPQSVETARRAQSQSASRARGGSWRSSLRDRRKESARDMWGSGATIEQIASALGVSVHTIKTYIGGELRRARRVAEAGSMALKGASMDSIAEQLDVSVRTARKYVREHDEGGQG